MSDFSARLISLRQEKGYSQEQLALKMGVTKQTISNYERDLRSPDRGTIGMLASILDCSVGYLMGTEEEINAQRRLEEIRAESLAYGEKKIAALLDKQSLPSNVRPINSLHRQRVPLIGSVAAGEPIYDPEDAGVYVESPVEADAAITIRGDSMVPTYLDGDLVYIKARPDVPDGAVAVVFLDDEATIKHVYKRPTGLTLISDNMATHPPLMVEFADYENVRIFGVPVGYTRIYKPGIAGKIRKGFR
ncbi:MAG: helix-turn-helix domain-containing protein [Clostridia bacterium]|nr:helix-turn-helix domain-containing protein [Clostridia bacterium]